jgi:hypothetical protein
MYSKPQYAIIQSYHQRCNRVMQSDRPIMQYPQLPIPSTTTSLIYFAINWHPAFSWKSHMLRLGLNHSSPGHLNWTGPSEPQA